MKTNFSNTRSNLVTRTSLFYSFLQALLMSGLIENNWVLISASAFNILQYHMSCSLWKTQLYNHESMSKKDKFHLCIIVKAALTLQTP